LSVELLGQIASRNHGSKRSVKLLGQIAGSNLPVKSSGQTQPILGQPLARRWPAQANAWMRLRMARKRLRTAGKEAKKKPRRVCAAFEGLLVSAILSNRSARKRNRQSSVSAPETTCCVIQ